MIYEEFPHEVSIQAYQKVSDGAGGYEQIWANVIDKMEAFCDTPTSREVFEAQQLNNPLDRNLFYPYRTDINEKMRCTFNGEVYELTGKPQDQGGMNEIMKVSMKLVRNA